MFEGDKFETREKQRSKMLEMIVERKGSFDEAKKVNSYFIMFELKKEMQFILDIMDSIGLDNGLFEHQSFIAEINKL